MAVTVGRSRQPGTGPLVLVVDDSAVVRQALTAILSAAGMQVEVAADPVIAAEKMRRRRPDALVLDIEMPRVDGLTFLRQVMAGDDPVPAVICSSLAGPGTDVAVQALEEGAVAIITKPRIGLKGFLEESATRLVDAVRGAAVARVHRRGSPVGPRLDAGRRRLARGPGQRGRRSHPGRRRPVQRGAGPAGGPEPGLSRTSARVTVAADPWQAGGT